MQSKLGVPLTVAPINGQHEGRYRK